jgi:hypothetical protein
MFLIGVGTPPRRQRRSPTHPAAKGVTFAYRSLASARRRRGSATAPLNPRQKA